MPLSMRWLTLLVLAPGVAPAQQRPAAAAGAGGPAVSPDGRLIAFSSSRDGTPDLYLSSIDGATVRRLTNSPEPEGRAQWSSDGRSLLFVRFAHDSSTLYRLAVDGGNIEELIRVPGRGALLSPDGQWVAYTAGSYTANRLIAVNLSDRSTRPLSTGGDVIFNHAFSPNGRQIAYTRMDPAGTLQLWVMNADGSDAHALTWFSPAEGRPQVPAWSPDGRRLAFQANLTLPDSSSTSHIYLLDLQAGALTRLAPHQRPYLDEVPVWFPDGHRLAFQSDRTGRMEIWMMNADGSEQRQVTR